MFIMRSKTSTSHRQHRCAVFNACSICLLRVVECSNGMGEFDRLGAVSSTSQIVSLMRYNLMDEPTGNRLNTTRIFYYRRMSTMKDSLSLDSLTLYFTSHPLLSSSVPRAVSFIFIYVSVSRRQVNRLILLSAIEKQ